MNDNKNPNDNLNRMTDELIDRIASKIYVHTFSSDKEACDKQSINIKRHVVTHLDTTVEAVQISIRKNISDRDISLGTMTMYFNVDVSDWHKIQEKIISYLSKKDIYSIRVLLEIIKDLQPLAQLKHQVNNPNALLLVGSDKVIRIDIPPTILLWVIENYHP